MLSRYRALDLTDHRCYLSGRILADLGVDVIKIEPPKGDPGRRIGPFYNNNVDPEGSLYWFANNLGKKGITLQIESPAGREIFKKLVVQADFIIESFGPGYMQSLGLGYEGLQEINRGLIMASISPFGQSGYYKNYKGSDIVVMAMGGLMYLTGDSDRPPVRISFPTAYMLASVQAVAGMLIALQYRNDTGLGQWVDVSAQEAVAHTLVNTLSTWELNEVLVRRTGQFWFRAGSEELRQRVIWPCQDGSVAFMILGGDIGARSNKALVKWMEEEGMADGFLKSIDWDNVDMATISQEFHERSEASIGKFFMAHEKLELDKEARKRGVFLQMVNSPREIFKDPQLEARGFWVDVEHPELHTSLVYAGPFVKSLECPIALSKRAPLIGEHNQDIFVTELGMAPSELQYLQKVGII
jgi:benzylsuccinate CoA-transferase BbsE subunit